jgi:hypothetical protein
MDQFRRNPVAGTHSQRADNAQAIVNSFSRGQKVTLRLTAVNNAGESSPSDDVTVVVG